MSNVEEVIIPVVKMNPDDYLKSFRIINKDFDTKIQVINNPMNKLMDKSRNEGCDLKLLVGEEKIVIDAHKDVVETFSKFFSTAMASPMKESNESKIELLALEYEPTEMVINFMYTGSIKLCIKSIHDILRTADFLFVDEVIDLCCSFFSERMNIYNCIEILLYAHNFSFTALKEVCRKYVVANFADVHYVNIDLHDLSIDLLLDLTWDEDGHISEYEDKNAESIFKLLWNSIKGEDKEEREKWIHRIFENVVLMHTTAPFREYVKTLVEDFQPALDKIKEESKNAEYFERETLLALGMNQ